jgi:uncharacterized OB-fold protein
MNEPTGRKSDSVPVTAGLFELDPDGGGRLLVGACGACDRLHFPATRDCPYCSAEGCTSRALSGQGTLCLFTIVINRPPGYSGEVPFGFGVVELPDDGLRVVSRLVESDPSVLTRGTPMRFRVVPLTETTVTWAFERA